MGLAATEIGLQIDHRGTVVAAHQALGGTGEQVLETSVRYVRLKNSTGSPYALPLVHASFETATWYRSAANPRR